MVEKNHTILNGPVGRILVIGLWLLTAALAAWEIFVVRALVVRLTTKLLMDPGGLSLIMANVWAYRTGAVAALVMGVVALAIVLGGMDLQMERIGRFPTWKVLLWVLVVELVVLGLSFLV